MWVCSCCLCVRCGSPAGCALDLSFGGPCMVLPCLSVYGLPLATDQVSQGGANMAACTCPECICFQKSMVVCCERSLWGVLSLERSMDMGRRV